MESAKKKPAEEHCVLQVCDFRTRGDWIFDHALLRGPEGRPTFGV